MSSLRPMYYASVGSVFCLVLFCLRDPLDLILSLILQEQYIWYLSRYLFLLDSCEELYHLKKEVGSSNDFGILRLEKSMQDLN